MGTFTALNVCINKNHSKKEKIPISSFTDNKIKSFCKDIGILNWTRAFDHDINADPLKAYDQQFSTELDEAVNKYFPFKHKLNKYKRRKCKWMTSELPTYRNQAMG